MALDINLEMFVIYDIALIIPELTIYLFQVFLLATLQ